MDVKKQKSIPKMFHFKEGYVGYLLMCNIICLFLHETAPPPDISWACHFLKVSEWMKTENKVVISEINEYSMHSENVYIF